MIAETRDQRNFIIRKYLDGGLIRVKRGDKWELSYGHTDEGGEEVVIVSVETGRRRNIPWAEFDVESFSFEPRLILVNERVTLVSRAGVQSTQRSLRQGDMEVYPIVNQYIWEHYTPFEKALPVAHLASDTIDVRLRSASLTGMGLEFVVPRTMTLTEGVSYLKAVKTVDVLLDKDFALSVSLSEDPRPWIWYHKLPVGKIDGNEVVVGHADFRQELADYLTHSGQARGWSLRG